MTRFLDNAKTVFGFTILINRNQLIYHCLEGKTDMKHWPFIRPTAYVRKLYVSKQSKSA